MFDLIKKFCLFFQSSTIQLLQFNVTLLMLLQFNVLMGKPSSWHSHVCYFDTCHWPKRICTLVTPYLKEIPLSFSSSLVQQDSSSCQNNSPDTNLVSITWHLWEAGSNPQTNKTNTQNPTPKDLLLTSRYQTLQDTLGCFVHSIDWSELFLAA